MMQTPSGTQAFHDRSNFAATIGGDDMRDLSGAYR